VNLATLDARRWATVAAAMLAFVAGVATSGSDWLWPAMAAVGAGTAALAWRADRIRLAALLRPDLRSIATGLAAGAVMVVATHVLYPIAAATFPGLEPNVALLYRPLAAPPGPTAALPILLLVVFAEELIWRGLLMDSLTARMPAAPSVVAGAALYALPQLANGSLLVMAVALVCGLVWGTERALTGGLAVPLITHALWSATVFSLAPLAG